MPNHEWLRLAVFPLLALCQSCQSEPPPITAAIPTRAKLSKPVQTHKFSYLALGDSYTIGEKVKPAETYPAQLAAKLREKGFDVADAEIVAVTGWTTADLLRGISSASLSSTKYDLVTLLIGVNNQYRGESMSVFIREFGTLLNEVIGFAQGKASKVVVVSIPDWSVTPYAAGRDRAKIGKDIDDYNRQSKAMCAAQGIAYVDITPISKKAADDPKLVAPDGLHPSGAMYSLWVPLILPAAEKAIKS